MADKKNDGTEKKGSLLGGLSHLIRAQDIHAYIDGQIGPSRGRAVEAFLVEDRTQARQAATDLRASLSLRHLRDEIYDDQALRSEIDRLLAKRRGSVSETDQESEPVRARAIQ